MNLVLAVTVLLMCCIGNTQVWAAKKVKPKAMANAGKTNHQRTAMEQWAASFVPENDYNGSNWRYMFRSRSASDYFDHYIKRLNKIFKENQATVNFASIGACDGMTDPTIKFRFLANDHWKGVFVEPMSNNYKDLVNYLAANNASSRSHVIQAAATSHCEAATIMVERPLYEEKNKSAPHWLRRQIGSIVPKTRDHARPEWMLEEVRCVTASDILTEWAALTGPIKNVNAKKMNTRIKKKRPHVLKIDVEGHDYDVLMSFVALDTPVQQLPLLIAFEAKSISKQFPVAKVHMESMGYVVSSYGQDGFALLRGDRMFPASAALTALTEGRDAAAFAQEEEEPLRRQRVRRSLSQARQARVRAKESSTAAATGDVTGESVPSEDQQGDTDSTSSSAANENLSSGVGGKRKKSVLGNLLKKGMSNRATNIIQEQSHAEPQSGSGSESAAAEEEEVEQQQEGVSSSGPLKPLKPMKQRPGASKTSLPGLGGEADAEVQKRQPKGFFPLVPPQLRGKGKRKAKPKMTAASPAS